MCFGTPGSFYNPIYQTSTHSSISARLSEHSVSRAKHVYGLCTHGQSEYCSKFHATQCFTAAPRLLLMLQCSSSKEQQTQKHMLLRVYIYIYTYTNMYGVTKWAITFSTDGYVYEQKLQVFRECKTAKLRRRRPGKANDRFTYVRKGFGA